ncbi:MAG: hypothetical protein ACRCXT_24215 [Paraclostridium sp.]
MTYILYKDNIKLSYIYADKHEINESKGINLYTNVNGLDSLVCTMFGTLEKEDNRYKIHLLEF